MSRDPGPDRDPEDEVMNDADLIDYLHDELAADARTRVELRLAASAQLAARMNQLKTREARLHALLHAVDPDDVSTRRSAGAARALVTPERSAARARGPQLLRAAAVILIIGAAALFVEPVRALVTDGMRTLGEALGVIGVSSDQTVPSAAVEPATTVRTAFAWSRPVFTVETAGSSTPIEAAHGDVGGAVITHPASHPITITPAGVSIAGGAGNEGLIAITLPPGVETLRVIRDGRATDHPLSALPVRIDPAPRL